MPAQPITENTSEGRGIDIPRRQILTVAGLLHGGEIRVPPAHGTFKQAQREGGWAAA